jgi:chromosome segregation ATPase
VKHPLPFLLKKIIMSVFGEVRNLNNRLEDYGYFKATGNLLLDEYDKALEEKVALQQQLNNTSASLKTKRDQLAEAWDDWKNCPSNWTRNKCVNKHRLPIENERINPLKTDINNLVGEVTTYQNRITAVNDRIEELQDKIDADNEATQILAEKGLTPQSVLQTKMIEAEGKTKTKKWVILSIVGVALLLTAIFIIRKIRKKK